MACSPGRDLPLPLDAALFTEGGLGPVPQEAAGLAAAAVGRRTRAARPSGTEGVAAGGAPKRPQRGGLHGPYHFVFGCRL